MGKFDTGLFIGRFQPFHKGHLHALRIASATCKKMIIGVGSSQESGTRRNPLTAEARIKVIKAALKTSGLDSKKIRFFIIPDFNDDEIWFGYIKDRLARIDVVFSGNSLVRKIFRKHDVLVITPKWYKRRLFSGTKVRDTIRKRADWGAMVPKGAADEISKHEDIIKKSK